MALQAVGCNNIHTVGIGHHIVAVLYGGIFAFPVHQVGALAIEVDKEFVGETTFQVVARGEVAETRGRVAGALFSRWNEDGFSGFIPLAECSEGEYC